MSSEWWSSRSNQQQLTVAPYHFNNLDSCISTIDNKCFWSQGVVERLLSFIQKEEEWMMDLSEKVGMNEHVKRRDEKKKGRNRVGKVSRRNKQAGEEKRLMRRKEIFQGKSSSFLRKHSPLSLFSPSHYPFFTLFFLPRSTTKCKIRFESHTISRSFLQQNPSLHSYFKEGSNSRTWKSNYCISSSENNWKLETLHFSTFLYSSLIPLSCITTSSYQSPIPIQFFTLTSNNPSVVPWICRPQSEEITRHRRY